VIRSSGRPRSSSTLSPSLELRLSRYALAASAAGVSVLALAQPAQGKVVYTKTHQVIGLNGIYPLDLNNDGTIDFLLQHYGTRTTDRMMAKEAFGNAMLGFTRYARYVSALKKGESIGRGRGFVSTNGPEGEIMAAYSCPETGRCKWIGQWPDVTGRYLGLKFQINGKTHYGWARISTRTKGEQITTTLNGYAYETVPGKAIGAGQTSEAGRVTSLGQLASGTKGAGSWGRP